MGANPVLSCVSFTAENSNRNNAGNRLTFKYEYDFGDGWEHEVLFEGSPSVDPKAKCPLCLEGVRQKTVAAFGATVTSSKRSAIQNTRNMRTCWSGSVAGLSQSSSMRSS